MVYKDNSYGMTALNCILSGGFGTALAFTEGLGFNGFNPIWIIGAAITIFGIFVLPVINFINRRSASMYRKGINGIAGLMSVSFFLLPPVLVPLCLCKQISGYTSLI